MRAILIDPFAETVEAIDVQPGLVGWYDAIQCACVDIVSLGTDPAGNSADMVIDDEGRLADGQRCFEIGEHLIAGRALIIGTDANSDGEACHTALSVDEVRRKVRFMPEGFDYEPPSPVVIGFSSFDMLQFLI